MQSATRIIFGIPSVVFASSWGLLHPRIDALIPDSITSGSRSWSASWGKIASIVGGEHAPTRRFQVSVRLYHLVIELNSSRMAPWVQAARLRCGLRNCARNVGFTPTPNATGRALIQRATGAEDPALRVGECTRNRPIARRGSGLARERSCSRTCRHGSFGLVPKGRNGLQRVGARPSPTLAKTENREPH